MTRPAQNLLIPSRFQLVVARLPNTQFYCSSVTIPGISVPEIDQPTRFNPLPVPGTRIYYGPFRITFFQDTSLSGWNDVFNWMTGLGRPVDDQQYANLAANSVVGGATTYGTRPPYSEMTLNIYTSKNNIQAQYKFVDTFPIELEPIELSYEESADNVLRCTASFKYSYYTYTYTAP